MTSRSISIICDTVTRILKISNERDSAAKLEKPMTGRSTSRKDGENEMKEQLAYHVTRIRPAAVKSGVGLTMQRSGGLAQ